MVENEKIEYALALNLSRFRKSARLAVGKVEDMDRNIRKSIKNSTAGFDQLKNQIMGIGVAATAVAVGGLLLLRKGLRETISLANVQEDAEVKLAGVIRATGGAAGFTTGELKAMAGGLQEITTAGDETVIKAQSVLATFKQIKGDQFRDATKAAIDMQTVVGGDLQGSVTRLGKALNDPIRGVSALNRVGVTFTEGQKETIKALQESGDIMGAQKVILNELESEFGGTAEAIRGTFKGSVQAASNAWGDLYEQTGYAITKNNFFIESAKLVEQKIIGLTEKIKGNEQAMRDLAKKGALAVIDGIGAAVEVVRFLYNGFQGVKLAFHGLVWLIAKDAEIAIKALRKILFPLDLLLTGLAKIGIIDSNPLKDLEKTAEGFADHLGDEFFKKLDKIEDTNKKFDAAKKKVADFRAEIAKISTEKVDVAQNIQDQVDKGTAATPPPPASPSTTQQQQKADDLASRAEKARKEARQAEQAADKADQDKAAALRDKAIKLRDQADKLLEQSKKNAPRQEHYSPTSYTGKGGDAFTKVNGVYQQTPQGPVKSTINNYQSPVKRTSDSQASGDRPADKIVELRMEGGHKMRGTQESVDFFVNLAKEKETAQ